MAGDSGYGFSRIIEERYGLLAGLTSAIGTTLLKFLFKRYSCVADGIIGPIEMLAITTHPIDFCDMRLCERL